MQNRVTLFINSWSDVISVTVSGRKQHIEKPSVNRLRRLHENHAYFLDCFNVMNNRPIQSMCHELRANFHGDKNFTGVRHRLPAQTSSPSKSHLFMQNKIFEEARCAVQAQLWNFKKPAKESVAQKTWRRIKITNNAYSCTVTWKKKSAKAFASSNSNF